jgi:hypothetical protein
LKPRRGPLTTIAALKSQSGICVACRERITPRDRVAWTVGRQRVHESCMPIWALVDRGRRPLGPWAAPSVRAFLERHQGRLCPACLALGVSLSLEEARAVVASTSTMPGFQILPATCSRCERETDVLCLVPSRPSPDSGRRAKCARCSALIEDNATGITVATDQFHASCWALLCSDDRIRMSRSLSRQSRQLIERSRAALDRPRPE